MKFTEGLRRAGVEPETGLTAKALDRLGKDLGYKLPPSYRQFLSEVGPTLGVFEPEDAFDKTHSGVRIPKGVFHSEIVGEKGRPIHTDHLVAFAEAEDAGGIWCFDIEAKGPELPVYHHNEDEPLAAKYRDDGSWVEKRAKPDYKTFKHWFEARLAEAIAEHAPATFKGSIPKKLARSKKGRLTLARAIATGEEHRKPIDKLVMDAKRVISTCPDYVVAWSIAKGKRLWSNWQYSGEPVGLAPDGRLAVGDYSGAVVRDKEDGFECFTFPHPDEPTSIRVNEDGLILVGSRKAVALWTLKRKQRWQRPLRLAGKVTSVAVSRKHALVTNHTTVALWDLAKGDVLATFKRKVQAHGLAFNKDGTLALVTDRKGGVELIDLKKRALANRWSCSRELGEAVFVGDGALAYLTASDGDHQLWDVTKGVAVDSIPHRGTEVATHGSQLVVANARARALLVYDVKL